MKPWVVAGKLLRQLAQNFADHSSSDCRQQYFGILRSAWQLRPAMHAALRPPLLSMLGDADPTLRAQALVFWDSALPKHVGLRLQALLQDSLTDAGSLVEHLVTFEDRFMPMLLCVHVALPLHAVLCQAHVHITAAAANKSASFLLEAGNAQLCPKHEHSRLCAPLLHGVVAV